MTSPDGITWTARAAAEANLWRSITYGEGQFVALAGSGTTMVMTSPDGITWTGRTAAEANGWNEITYGNGQFVAVSSTGTNRVMTSPDGITWTARAAAEAASWQSITYGNGQFVAVSSDGTNRVMTSLDGITWTGRTAAEANSWLSIVYNNGLFVAVSSSGTNRVMTSGDVALSTRGSVEITGELEVEGSALFRNISDTTNAFDVQNSSSQSLFTIDTTNAGKVTILGNNGGEIDPWKTNANALPNQRYQPGSATYNGYVYVVGGWGSTTTDYAKLNADGSIGTWQTSASALPAARHNLGVFVANGYIYAIGGNDTSATQSTVYYAKLAADGSIGTWRTNANALPLVREAAGVVTSGGYAYVIGGYNGSASQSTVYYAKLNADGTIGAWQTNANALPLILDSFSTVVANGYIHLIGGYSSSTGLLQSTVYSGKINGDGTVDAWTSAGNGSLPALREYGNAVVNNGYVYYMGGQTTGGVNQSTVYYAKLNGSGVVGAWSTSTHALPDIRSGAGSIVANGYIYELGGTNGATQTTAYYARAGGVLQVGGSLDLVGLQGQTLADGGDSSAGSTGGSITAGNITAVGSFQVQGQAAFASSASVAGDFNAGNGIFSVETGNTAVRIGSSTADTTGVVLILDTKNSAGDPTGVNGAMYYNSNLSKFRCYQGGAWEDCISGYSINVQALTSSPTDAQTVYFGTLPKAPTTTAAISKIYIRKAGVIKAAEIYNYSGTAGTNESWSLYIRKNNTTDTLIATVSAATNERVFTNSSLSISVAAGDYVEIKGVQPTWVTNPVTSIYGGYLYIE
jgi:N-acetylneuraminic acid mutarotase